MTPSPVREQPPAAPVTGEPPAPRRLLVVDDDVAFCAAVERAMSRRGFAVTVAHDVDAGRTAARTMSPSHALVDLRMPGPSGLVLVPELRSLDAAMRIVVLTGYASIATAVEAIKLGATHYLAKPVDADDIVAAFGDNDSDSDVARAIGARPLSVDRLEWEHIQKVLADHEGNISATARALGMHRRTLQRKLGKNPPTP